jgi:hypothetical protein
MAEFEGSQIADNTKKRLALLRERGQLTGKIPYDWDCTYVFTDGTTLHRGVVLTEAALAALVTRHGHVLRKDMTINHPEQARILEMARCQNSFKMSPLALRRKCPLLVSLIFPSGIRRCRRA